MIHDSFSTVLPSILWSSQNFVLVLCKAEAARLNELIFVFLIVSIREDPVKSLTHGWWTADPDSLDVLRVAKLANFLLDPSFVPSSWVDVLLGKSHIKMETV